MRDRYLHFGFDIKNMIVYAKVDMKKLLSFMDYGVRVLDIRKHCKVISIDWENEKVKIEIEVQAFNIDYSKPIINVFNLDFDDVEMYCAFKDKSIDEAFNVKEVVEINNDIVNGLNVFED